VTGVSTNNIGAYGNTGSSNPAVKGVNTGSGAGVFVKSASGNALYVEGINYFKSAKRGTIPSGVAQFDVTVPSGVKARTSAMIFATLMNNPGNVAVK